MRLYYHDNKLVSFGGPNLNFLFSATLTYKDDCRHPHDSGKELSPTDLLSLGVLYYSFPPSSPTSAVKIEDLARTSKYANRDEITVSPEGLGEAYKDKIKMFFDEHMHEDEEIRYILKGTGYFDVRDAEDRWIRIRAEPGDLLILPAGIYHRFTVDEENVSDGSPYPDCMFDFFSTSMLCVSFRLNQNGLLYIAALRQKPINTGKTTFMQGPKGSRAFKRRDICIASCVR